MLAASSGLCFFHFLFCDDNVDGDVDGDGHGGDDDTICVTRRTLKLSCNRLYDGRKKQRKNERRLHAHTVLREKVKNTEIMFYVYTVATVR